MQNPHRNIELGARRQPNLPYQVLNDAQEDPQNNQDQELDHLPPQRPHPSSLSSKLSSWAPKIACTLLIFSLIIEIGAFCVSIYVFADDRGTKLFFDAMEIRSLPESLSDAVESISASLKADPIMDLKVLDKNSTCPTGFEFLKLGTWPGTRSGCLLKNGDLVDSPCEVKQDGVVIAKTEPIDMYEWDNSIFCVKRAVLETDYLKKAECPSEYKECYPGGCFLKDCPITGLEIAPTGATNKFHSEESKYVILTRIQGELPLINIQMVLNGIPCFNQGDYARFQNGNSYKLLAHKTDGCDEYGSDGYFSTRLDFHSAFDSYVQNNFPDSVMKLPYFEKNAKDTISVLSWTVRMKTAKHDFCLNLEQESIERSFSHLKGSAGMSILALFALGGKLVCLLSLYSKEDNRREVRKRAFAGVLYVCFHVGLALFFYNDLSQKFLPVKESLERFEALECLALGQGNMMVQEYLEIVGIIQDCGRSLFVAFCCSVVETLIGICYYIKVRRSSL